MKRLNINKYYRYCSYSLDAQEANQQHYEVPTAFSDLSLGLHKKYSSCFWSDSTKNLEEAEQLALNFR